MAIFLKVKEQCGTWIILSFKCNHNNTFVINTKLIRHINFTIYTLTDIEVRYWQILQKFNIMHHHCQNVQGCTFKHPSVDWCSLQEFTVDNIQSSIQSHTKDIYIENFVFSSEIEQLWQLTFLSCEYSAWPIKTWGSGSCH